jgi:hypothetical protein
MGRVWVCLVAALAVLLMFGGREAFAQQDVESRMAELLHYTGVENPSPGDVARMAELWRTAQETSITSEQRRTAFRELYTLFGRLHGQEVAPAAVEGLAQFAAFTFDAGGRMDLRLPEPRGKPSGQYLQVETRGHGPTTLLLISDLGVDGRKLYDAFAKRNEKSCTMYIVTLPLAGAARPLPWPERLNYAARPWLRQIENELVALLDQSKVRGTTVIGTSVGGYFAVRLALLRPKQVRAIVVVDALVAMNLRARSSPDAPLHSRNGWRESRLPHQCLNFCQLRRYLQPMSFAA